MTDIPHHKKQPFTNGFGVSSQMAVKMNLSKNHQVLSAQQGSRSKNSVHARVRTWDLLCDKAQGPNVRQVC